MRHNSNTRNEFNQFKKELIKSLKSELLIELQKENSSKRPTEYLSRKQVTEMLGINLSTLHNYCIQKKLIKYGLGSRVFFKREEVENALIKIN